MRNVYIGDIYVAKFQSFFQAICCHCQPLNRCEAGSLFRSQSSILIHYGAKTIKNIQHLEEKMETYAFFQVWTKGSESLQLIWITFNFLCVDTYFSVETSHFLEGNLFFENEQTTQVKFPILPQNYES